jgi:hypothetical protein
MYIAAHHSRSSTQARYNSNAEKNNQQRLRSSLASNPDIPGSAAAQAIPADKQPPYRQNAAFHKCKVAQVT